MTWGPHGIAPVAARQLAAWEAIGREWKTAKVFDVDTGTWNEACAECWDGLYRLTDRHGKPYAYSEADRLAAIVAHLRRSHLDLDPDPAVTRPEQALHFWPRALRRGVP